MICLVDAHTTYQAGLDVERVAREGYGGLLVKATQGASGYTAPATFDDWIRRGRAAGMVVGAYHWLTSAPAGAQLDHYLGRLAKVGGPDGMLCAVDVEDTAAPPTWATLRAFVSGWQERTGGHPLILYSGAWWWGPRGWPGATLTPHLWHSRYVTGSGPGSVLYGAVPESWWSPAYGGWAQATLLQFTSSALVAGQRVDVSAFRGTREQLLALTRPASSGGVMTKAERLVEAWDGGFDVTTEGEHCELTVRQRRIDDFQVHVAEVLDRLAARPGGSVVLGETDRAAIVAGVTAGVAAEVISQIAPALRQVAQLADRLGAAGDALGALNDPPSEAT